MAVNTNVSRLGQINGAGDDRALFLKVFSGEVLTTFEKMCKMKSRIQTRTLTSGKSAQFPVMGTAVAEYHTAGQNILDPANNLLNNIEHAERVISIDKKLTASVTIADVDEAINHYEVRSNYSYEIGDALAQRYDKATIKVTIAAARTVSTLTRDGDRVFGGSRIFSDAAGGSEGLDDVNLDVGVTFTTALQLSKALYAAKTQFDKKNIPSSERCAFVTPEDYNLLISEFPETQLNRIINKDIGGEGSYATGEVGRIAGFDIVMSNNMPNGQDLSAVSTGDGQANNDVFGSAGIGYNGDFTGTRILCFHKSAIGTVQLRDLATEMERKIEYQVDLLVAKYLLGHGVLRPEAAIEISDGNLV
jgi:hypothetical protein